MRNVLTIWITEVQKCRFSRILLTGSTCAQVVTDLYSVFSSRCYNHDYMKMLSPSKQTGIG